MAFPALFLDELVERNPIEDVVSQYVNLTRKGGNLFGLCPFHGEKTPSFSVAPDKGMYYCFGCHKGGGVVNFIMEIENLSYADAVRFLAKRAGMEVPEDERYQSRYRQQERLWALSKEAARFFRTKLFEKCGEGARAYLSGRGLSAQTVSRFGLGYSPDAWSSLTDAMIQKGYQPQELLDAGLAVRSKKNGAVFDRFRNRVMFPIIDVRGNVIGFGGRVMDNGEPKYLNSPETIIFNKRKNLFALNLAKKSKQGRIILCEGYMDAITMHQYGFDCAVASLGTALTQEHAAILSKYTDEIVLTYDSDAPGQNATRRAIPMLEKVGLKVKVLRMQGAKDPDEYLKKFGADRFRLLLEQSQNHVEYRLLSLQAQFDLSIDEQRVEFLKQATDVLASLDSPIEREIYTERVAELAKIPADAVKLEVERGAKRRRAYEKKQEERRSLTPAALLQPKVKSVRYDNIRSAKAEEVILQQLLKEPALFDRVRELQPEQFSVPLFSRVFQLLRERYAQGLLVSVSALEGDLTQEEISHLSAIVQTNDRLVNEKVLYDCVAVVQQENRLRHADGADALMAIREQMKKKKGIGE